jgi:DNA mismatch repair protein MutS
VAAAGAIVAYLRRTNADLLNLLSGFHTESDGRFLVLDAVTRRNLDLLRSARSGSARGGLLAVLDRTHTPMGGRLLRRTLGQPLVDIEAIEQRLDAVAALAADGMLRRRLTSLIDRVSDAERLTGRVAQGTATPRDCLALAATLRRVPALSEVIAQSPALVSIAADLDCASDCASLIERAVSDEEDRLVRRGYDPAIDALLDAAESAQHDLLQLEARERERTGIRSLKVGYTRVFGYYIELTRPNVKHAPADYHHKQTLANAERYVTPALRECEAAIVAAQERTTELEREVYATVLRTLAAERDRLLRTAAALASLDVLIALADVAAANGWTRPAIDSTGRLEIRGGRHPVVEERLNPGEFIANDCTLDADGCQIALVTGPNMAGKSTYLRQIALCVLLAQIGSFVPAAAARIGIVDRIFTRIGAQDDIAAGASTFMVEMVETAAILRHATPRSLVLLDEVGRGTSTDDGLAIAQAVIEYLHHHLGSRTLFATHFHELTSLTSSLPRLRTFNVSAVEEAGRLIFLHRVLPGASDRSYGVQVARLAGVPPLVAARAEQLLRQTQPRRTVNEARADGGSLIEELASLDVLRLSPLEALARLQELHERAGSMASAKDGVAVLAHAAAAYG